MIPKNLPRVIEHKLRKSLMAVQEAQVVVFGAPPVDGLGNTGGFKLQVQDKGDIGFDGLEAAVTNLARRATPSRDWSVCSAVSAQISRNFTSTSTAQRPKAWDWISTRYSTPCRSILGSAYVNDFTRFGRNWQVNVQADSSFRARPSDIGKLKVRNNAGQMVPLQTLVNVRNTSGPAVVNRYNMYPSAEINGNMAPGHQFGSGHSHDG